MSRKTTLAHVVTAARTVRSGLLRKGAPRDLAGQCGLAAMLVAAATKAPKILRVGFYMNPARFHGLPGRCPHGHAWCQIDATIVDVTATQFNRRLHAIHQISAIGNDRYVEIARGHEALDQLMTDWRGRGLPEYKNLAKRLRAL